MKVILSIAIAVLALAGCATAPPPTATGPDGQTPQGSPTSPQQESGPRVRIADPLTHAAVEVVAARTVDLTVAPDDVWKRVRRGFSVPNIDTPLVQEWEEFYSRKPEYLQRIAARAGKYLFYIVEEIDRRGMPTELALLPFVESAYDPWAYSPAKASGLWQFIPSTGRGYNLKQDWWRDERRDPIASTNAALDYLEYLFDFHGDWHLALASYNWGEGSVKRAIEKNAGRDMPTDYLSLDMPNETRNYIPKLQAIKNIIAHPQDFNVQLPVVDNTPYFVTITRNRDIDVPLAAKLAEMPVEEFKALNPSFNRNVILGRHEPTLILPTDRVAIFETNLKSYDGALSSWGTHTVARGEKLPAIAKRYNLSVATLTEANGLTMRSAIETGQVLLIPTRATSVQVVKDAAAASRGRAVEAKQEVVSARDRGRELAAAKSREQAAAASRTRQQAAAVAKPQQQAAARGRPQAAAKPTRTHKVVQGDTLASIAQRYRTSVSELTAANNGIAKSVLRIGTAVRIPPG
ncbi:LysM peptidoglycan-binding domain-containing protein [Pigmentiphaga aceris]|uniref:LysM peptidoglycan-binding domain-containing protein n=1 Tax=Pigmentiphaga aceris TaxID=1940612 RepID=A0A5C0ASQ4_9BURK|nr:LysM peptidoglycan-binding domain-containing protein [Pigmentiphaga aceris]QEI05312.1 LysM peptidoglycan-binding domain-containing protein [Pigmentiphaga aceris]